MRHVPGLALIIGLCASVLGSAGTASAQQYPAQTIRMLVGFGPGSSADILARLVARHAEAKLGKPVVV